MPEVKTDGPRNIVIYSDGTGQRGGRFFDEDRTNIYKLYRATRVAPNSSIRPNDQIAFYDPGLGTQTEEGTTVERFGRKLYNIVSQATGLGITRNIIECYAALIRLWRPGDRIFLFGFSRGAYTVRCLASVICMCGIPTSGKKGSPLLRDRNSSIQIATRAVKSVYQHVSSPRDTKFAQQRSALAKAFRADFSADNERGDGPNTYPFFIGVFDTVAALSSFGSLAVLFLAYLAAHAALAFLLSIGFAPMRFWYWFGWTAVWTVCAFITSYIYTHMKFAWHIPGYFFWDIIHLTTFRQEFYDQNLNPNVKYARHAISIDERRGDFKRVRWGGPGSSSVGEHKINSFEQIWFAGNHADIGGGYAENESRLSDISLGWIIQEASNEKLGDEKLIVDRAVLEINGDSDGMQHDEARNSVFRWAKKTLRETVPDATLHPSVLHRFANTNGVLQYDVTALYRPETLRHQRQVEKYYVDVRLPRVTCWQWIEQTFKQKRNFVWKTLGPLIGRAVYSLYPSDWKEKNAMTPPTKQLTPDSIASCLGLLLLVLFAGMGIWIFVFDQIIPWLREAIWHSYPLSLYYAQPTGWMGADIILDWIYALPITLVLVVVGIILFWCFGIISTKLYQSASKQAGQNITPAQTHF